MNMRALRWFGRHSGRGGAAGRPSVRPMLEKLEDRTVPTTFSVSNENNSGKGSLHQAIGAVVLTVLDDDGDSSSTTTVIVVD
jgi:hypothetical protein